MARGNLKNYADAPNGRRWRSLALPMSIYYDIAPEEVVTWREPPRTPLPWELPGYVSPVPSPLPSPSPSPEKAPRRRRARRRPSPTPSPLKPRNSPEPQKLPKQRKRRGPPDDASIEFIKVGIKAYFSGRDGRALSYKRAAEETNKAAGALQSSGWAFQAVTGEYMCCVESCLDARRVDMLILDARRGDPSPSPTLSQIGRDAAENGCLTGTSEGSSPSTSAAQTSSVPPSRRSAP